MRRSKHQIRDGRLLGVEDAPAGIAVGSAEWFAWLEGAAGFAFVGAAGGFTARKEQRGAHGYWKAYRRRAGTLHRAYLGKSNELTLARLEAVATQLANEPTAEHTAAPPPPLQMHVLSTKIAPPPPRPGSVERLRLLALLNQGLRGRLTLVIAPAGAGKTTLLTAWHASLSGPQPPSPSPQSPHTAWHTSLPGPQSPVPSPQSPIPIPQSPHTAWLALDADDNDPPRFWHYLVAALGRVVPGAVAVAQDLLRGAQLPPAARLVTALVNGLDTLPGHLVLVLDDYQAIETPAIHAALGLLIERLPPRVHLVIGTRSEPPLPLHLLRARGELTEVRAADLRFSSAEAAQLIAEVLGQPLDAAALALLAERTEGWAAGLQLAALALRGRDDPAAFVRDFGGGHRYVVDYLLAEVFARQLPHIQHFLLQTALLDRMCGELCDELLGWTMDDGRRTMDHGRWTVDGGPGVMRPPSSIVRGPSSAPSYSQRLLEELERANLFVVALDGERRWYRYHHLFADLLRQRLAQGASAGEVATLHRRASRWYARAGLLHEAVGHALAGGDFGAAAGLVAGARRSLMTYGVHQGQTLGVWLRALPEAVVLAHPALCLAHAWMLARGDVAAAETWVERAEQALQQGAEAAGDERTLRGEIAALRALIAASRGESAMAAGYGRAALADLDEDNLAARADVAIALGRGMLSTGELGQAEAAFAEAQTLGQRADNSDMALVAACNRAYILRAQGLMAAALAVCRQALAWAAARGAARSVDSAWVLAALADLLREQNDLAGALRAASEALEQSSAAGSDNLVGLCLLVLARVRQALGEPEAALELLEELRRRLDGFRVVPLGQLVGAFGAQLALQRGDLGLARAWAAAQPRAGASPRYGISPILLVYSYEHATIALPEVLLALGRDAGDETLLLEAQGQLIRLHDSPEAARTPWLRIRCAALLALAADGLGDEGRGRGWLRGAIEAALRIALNGELLRVFLDLGQPLARLTAALGGGRNAISAASAAGRYTTRLRNAFSQTASKEAGGGLAEQVSERELAVLRLLADGLDQRGIAVRLVLSANTVKSHLRSLYGKLGVHTRAEAIARGREMGLL